MPSKEDGRKNNTPPIEGRFKRGQSGNPRGRPKQTSINVDEILGSECAEVVNATGNRGQKIRLTKVEATAHQVVNAALRGDNKMIAFVLNMATKIKDAGALQETIVVHFNF